PGTVWKGETPMLVTKITCPHCGVALKTARPMAAGSRVSCPQCTAPFTVTAADLPVASPVQAVPMQVQVLPVYPAAAPADIRPSIGVPQARPAAGFTAHLSTPQSPIIDSSPTTSRGPMLAVVCGGLLLFVGAGVV